MSCLRGGCWGRRSDGIHMVGKGRGRVDVGMCAGCWLGSVNDRGGRGELAMPARGMGMIWKVLRFCR